MPRNSDEAHQGQARQTLPEDRFDRLEKAPRVGAHRIAARPHRFWAYLVAAVVGVVILSAAGILALQLTGGNAATFTRDTGEETVVDEGVKPQIDPEASVAILNGTPTPNLQAGLEQVITENGWGKIAFTDNAASTEVQISAVFYSAPEDEAAAAGLAQELGGVSYYQSNDYDEYGVRLIVLLGADYAGPGFEQAAEITVRMQGAEGPAETGTEAATEVS